MPSRDAAKVRYAIEIVGFSAMTVALILNALHPDTIGLAILAFGAFCFTLAALRRYRNA